MPAELFLSTPSARRATTRMNRRATSLSYFYPRPPRGGRPFLFIARHYAPYISIHALREEGDKVTRWKGGRKVISIHALREEGDGLCGYLTADEMRFLSTPSARRATWMPLPKLPWEDISIHALREEGDLLPFGLNSTMPDFYPRPPRGGRHTITLEANRSRYFYPRPPRGGRPWFTENRYIHGVFLSTPSARRATTNSAFPLLTATISIHALREEGDKSGRSWARHPQNFYPRPPRGGRLQDHGVHVKKTAISIHALREEGDLRHVQGSTV